MASEWEWRNVEGTSFDISPSIDLLTISALLYDQAIIIIFLAFFMVFIPIVIAALGTLSMPPKDVEASLLVTLCRYTNLVQLLIGDGG